MKKYKTFLYLIIIIISILIMTLASGLYGSLHIEYEERVVGEGTTL